MEKKNIKKNLTINALGRGAREVYLEKNPHGFSNVTKIHLSKKRYKRTNNLSKDYSLIF
jgi:hypothetical protein